MTLLFAWIGLTLLVFIAGCAIKALRYATMPIHLRWELYPVAHEKGKVAYGGSYFEELDWWTKPREVSKFGEVKVIAEEVLTLKQVHENNPPLWLPSLAFHWGLYLLFALGAVVAAGAVGVRLGLPVPALLTGGKLLSWWGAAALALGTLGALGLLFRRLGDAALRASSMPADFVHLWLFLALFVASWGSFFTVDRDFGAAATLLATGSSPAAGNPWFIAQLVLLGLFLAYMPWSHMAHMFTKYFTWHSVRWEDRPNLSGAGIDEQVVKLLALPVSWSAPHIRGDGKRNWLDVVSEGGES